MDYEEKILNILLDKYENSAHFKGDAAVNRRILLKCSESALNLDFSDYKTCDDFKQSVIGLANKGYIQFDWKREDCLVNQIWLMNDSVDEIYQYLERPNKRSVINIILSEIQNSINMIHTDWILGYLQNAYLSITVKHTLTGIWSNPLEPTFNFLKALREIDKLNGKEISMRAFSVALFSNSKYFERNIKSALISVIRKYEPSASEAEKISDRDALAQVGIIMMPEVFEFCGNISMVFQGGTTDFSPITKGACISSDCIDDINAINIRNTKRILFIENKTNYSEYVLNEYQKDELVIYHGGFFSPSKAKFFREIYKSSNNIPTYFWGDIDLGGFRMFNRLKRNIIHNLQPLNMDVTSYDKFSEYGVNKNDAYIGKIKELQGNKDYAIFFDVIKLIIDNKLIVEQEIFLSEREMSLV